MGGRKKRKETESEKERNGRRKLGGREGGRGKGRREANKGRWGEKKRGGSFFF